MASFFSSHVESITLNAAVTTALQRGFMRSKGTDSFPRDQEARFTAQDARERERGEREGAATAAAAGSRLGDDGGTRGARLFACLVVLCGLVLAHGECSAGRPRVASAVQARASCPEIFPSRKFLPLGHALEFPVTTHKRRTEAGTEADALAAHTHTTGRGESGSVRASASLVLPRGRGGFSRAVGQKALRGFEFCCSRFG